MSHYYVLGHSFNPIIQEYFEKYFIQLQDIFKTSKLSDDIKNRFFALHIDSQKEFLTQSDISCLLQDLKSGEAQSSFLQLEKEIQYFLDNKKELCTFSQGDFIPGTHIRLTTHDNNPKNNIINHPDHSSEEMIGWGKKSQEEWGEVFGKSFSLLKKINEDFYNELNTTIQKIVPFNTSSEAHNSCTYKESIGVLYLGYTIDAAFPEISILEALIHESSHNKLNLIMQSENLVINDSVEKYYSPYRPDARPIYGVYLGVHAIIPTIHTMVLAVQGEYIKDSVWFQKIILYHIKNKIGMKVLRKYARCTSLGYEILDELEDVLKICDTFILGSTQLQSVDTKDVYNKAKSHFIEVQKNYPQLEY